MTNPHIWISLPVDNERDIPQLFDGDSYLVRRTNGEEIWACFVLNRGAYFAPCDDDGEPIGPALDDVVAVQVSSYAVRRAG